MTDTPENIPHDSQSQDQQNTEPSAQQELDLNYISSLWGPAMLFATQMQYDREQELEHDLAELVRDELVNQVPLSAEQRDQIQLEIRATTFSHIYSVKYVLPSDNPNKPRTAFCIQQEDGRWEATVYQGTKWMQKGFPDELPIIPGLIPEDQESEDGQP